jgi:hypothetical protein
MTFKERTIAFVKKRNARIASWHEGNVGSAHKCRESQ